MKIAFWKKLLSHFTDIVLEKKQSDYSNKLEIILSRGRVALCTQNAMYSFEDLYLNFRESFHKIGLSKFKIEKVMVLGAGLLSVPYLLEKKHQKRFHCKAIDVDPAVIDAATRYGLPKLSSKVELICSDAAEFIERDLENYDLLVVDIFIDDKVPEIFETSDFLEKLKNRMEPGAILMFNRMAQNSSALRQTEEFYNDVFKNVFMDSEMLIIKGNRMLIAYSISKN